MTIINDEPDKVDLKSLDIAEEKRQELLRLYPEARTEGGKIDFDRLKLALGEMVDVGKERYGMTWPGKAECFRTIQAPSTATLRPMREESVNWDTTENLIIEGDNLEVLKLLQKAYLGKVKMIYIDPPYNTGNDFIYPDNYSESLQTYLEYTGQVDAQGKKFGTNTETDGRFHSKGLNMMYPRLTLARQLLQPDGLLFVSIDDVEAANAKRILDEIFGEENFVDTIIWKKRYGGGAKEKYLVSLHEYILAYARNKPELPSLSVPLSQESIERYYRNRDEYFEQRGPFRTHPLEATKSFGERKNLRFPITAPDGTPVWPKRQWLWGETRVVAAQSAGELHFARDRNGDWTVHTKQYLRDGDEQREAKFFSVIDDVFTQQGTNEILELFGDAHAFPFPKPSALISRLLPFATSSDESDVVLDFFAGSGTTADAVLQQNMRDGGKRRFVLVQLPEPVETSNFRTLSEVTRKRARKVIAKLQSGKSEKLPHLNDAAVDLGFRALTLSDSNFVPWKAGDLFGAKQVEEQLELHVAHVRQGRTQEDILFEILLKEGYSPAVKVETRTIGKNTVYSVADGLLLVCLERNLSLDTLRAVADLSPQRVVCLDEGFEANDQLKANAVQIFKSRGIVFRTV